ncbi:hypothetical protein KY362_00500 [Candidatus Woesearchaeota archaeon]|nr:hypothetical protein [Candidatus Woesearchaeota archaeon]
MTDHYETGKRMIIDAAEAQLAMMEKAKSVEYATIYGTSDIFTIALRRVGEDGLAEKFVDPAPEAKPRVLRENHSDDILTGIIASIEQGNPEFAAEIERGQRETFYAEGIAYLHPHWFELMKPDTKQRLQKGIAEHGTELGQCNVEIDPFSGKKRARTHIGALSLPESIFAIYGNLATGDREHAGKVIEKVFDLYFDEETGLFMSDRGLGSDVVYTPMDRTASMCKALNMAGDERGNALFKGSEWLGKELAEKSSYRGHTQDARLATYALALEHFGEDAGEAREAILSLKMKPAQKPEQKRDTVYFGHDSYQNAKLVRCGLALTGLEKGKLNEFYMP